MNGFILYKGKSRLDNKSNIVAIVTGTKNVKTGQMLQTWILPDKINPVEANRTGKDVGVCGDCKHKGTPNDNLSGVATGRSCYVMPIMLSNIWKKYRDGGYDKYDPKVHDELFKKYPIRFGSFGEFTALPREILKHITSLTPAWTMYTHQWKKVSKHFKKYSMASVDSIEEKQKANKLGYRTYRIAKPGETLLKDEILCPASNEFEAQRGYKITCEQCRLCCGTERKARNIAIFPHGLGKKYIGLEILQ